MKKIKLILLFLIFFITKSSIAFCLTDEEFVNKIRNKISEDCHNKEITIKELALLDISSTPNTINAKEIKYKLSDEKSYQALGDAIYILLKRPFGKYLIKDSEPEFYGIQPNFELKKTDGEKIQIPFNGYNTLRCEGHQLDINDNVFYWDNERIEIVDNINIEAGAKATFGNYSDIIEAEENANIIVQKQGDNSQVNIRSNNNIKNSNLFIQLFFSKGTIGGLSIAGLMTIFFRLFAYYKNKTKTQRF